MSFVGSPSLGHQTIHYITVGHPAAQAALAVSVCGVVMTASKFLYGAATDNFGAYRVNYVYLPIWILANIATACANGTSALILFAAATLNGIGVSSGSIGISVWVGDLSPAKDYAQNIQQSQTLFSLGSLLGTSVPGIIADAIGSYAPFYVASGIISVLIMAIVQSLYRKHLVKKVCTMP